MTDSNIFNTIYYPTKVLIYFEKHHIFHIFSDLMVLLDKVRPKNIRKFIAKNIVSVAQNYHRKITFILAPPLFNYNKFAESYTKLYGAPVIQYTKKRTPNDGDKIVKNLKKFLKHNHLEEKHLITINFPKNRDEILNFTKANLSPENVYEIKPGFQVPFKTQEQHADEHRTYLAHFQEVKNYYKSIYAKINYGVNNEKIKELNEKEYLNYNYVTFSHHLHNSIRHNFAKDRYGDQSTNSVMYQRNISTWYVPRVIIYGRIGSGRTTQAAILSYRFGLILISVELLVEKYMDSQCPIGDAVRHSKIDNDYSDFLLVTILHKRVLQADCLEYGWVVYDFPNTRSQMELICEHFLKPPNKIIFLHVNEETCRERVKKKINCHNRAILIYKSYSFKVEDDYTVLINPQGAEDYISAQYKFFGQNCRDIYDFCKTRPETININGNFSAYRVKTAIWARVEQNQIPLKGEIKKKSNVPKKKDSKECNCEEICMCNN